MRNNALKEEAGKGKAKSGLREGYSAKAINKAERKKDLQKESSALSILHQHNKQLHKGPRFLANSLSLHSISLSIAYRFALNRAQTPPLDVLSCHSLSRPGLLRSTFSYQSWADACYQSFWVTFFLYARQSPMSSMPLPVNTVNISQSRVAIKSLSVIYVVVEWKDWSQFHFLVVLQVRYSFF